MCVCVRARARVRGCSRACLCVRKRALDQGKRGTNQILSETGAENRGAKTILEIQYETQENKFSMMRGGGGGGGGTGEQANYFKGTCRLSQSQSTSFPLDLGQCKRSGT